MRSALALALFFGIATQSVCAVPGQTQRQLAAWGKSNGAFAGFQHAQDRYVATIAIDGFHANFTAPVVNGTVHHEQFAFINMAPNWQLERSWKFDARVLRMVYGERVAADVLQPQTGLTVRHVAVRLGHLYAYAASGHTLRVYEKKFYQHVVLQAKGCDTFECGGNS